MNLNKMTKAELIDLFKDEIKQQRLIIIALESEVEEAKGLLEELDNISSTVRLQCHELTSRQSIIEVQEKTIKKLFDTVFKLSNAIDKLMKN